MNSLREIMDEFFIIKNDYRVKYANVLIDILKELDVWDVPVRNKLTGKTGKLLVIGNGMNITCQVKFFPYNKNGTLSKKSSSTVYSWDETDVRESILNHFEVA